MFTLMNFAAVATVFAAFYTAYPIIFKNKINRKNDLEAMHRRRIDFEEKKARITVIEAKYREHLHPDNSELIIKNNGRLPAKDIILVFRKLILSANPEASRTTNKKVQNLYQLGITGNVRRELGSLNPSDSISVAFCAEDGLIHESDAYILEVRIVYQTLDSDEFYTKEFFFDRRQKFKCFRGL